MTVVVAWRRGGEGHCGRIDRGVVAKMEPSSAQASVDPDRITIQYFENGGANPQQERIALVRLYA